MLHCAIGIIKKPENQILISQRPLHKIGGGFWEFPGGKVGVSETVEEALIRELKEEVGITATSFERYLKFPYAYESYEVLLDVFLINHYLGEPDGLEGQRIAWVDIQNLKQYAFLEANTRIIENLLSDHNP